MRSRDYWQLWGTELAIFAITMALVIGAMAGVLALLSISGAPTAQHLIGMWLLAFGSALLPPVVHAMLGPRYQRPCWLVFHFLFRLWLGLALFPVICVLFLNRSRF